MILETKIDWRARTLGSLIGLWLVLGLPMTAAANSVSLAWNANTEADLAGYRVYAGTSPGAYTQTFDVGRKTSYSVSDLIEGATYYFVLTAYDIYGNESGYSTVVTTTIVSAAAGNTGSVPADTSNSTADNTSNSTTTDTSGSTTGNSSGSTAGNSNDSVDHSSWSSWWNLLFGS